MFQHTHLGKRSLVQKTLKERILSKPPGSEYAYSNLGYCILGLVIEELTDMSYEDYVKQAIFKPAGANTFMLGSRKKGVSPLEVTYYADTGEDPYWFPVRRMDAHGGWIANATDLVRFLLHTDGRDKPADLINAASIKTMTTPGKFNNNYAMGWNVNENNNWWHMGSLPGSASVMVRTSHGYSWAVLTNRHSDDKNFMGELDGLTWKLLEGLKDSL